MIAQKQIEKILKIIVDKYKPDKVILFAERRSELGVFALGDSGRILQSWRLQKGTRDRREDL